MNLRTYKADLGRVVLRDLATGDEVSVEEVLSLAKADPEYEVNGPEEFAAMFEGLSLSIGELRAAREGLQDLLDRSGLETLDVRFLGNPGAAADLPVKAIRGIGKNLAKILGEGTTIATFAEMDISEVLTEALNGVPEGKKKQIEANVRKTHATANRILSRRELWRNR